MDNNILVFRLIYSVKSPVQLIVFEDMKASGYHNVVRSSGFDEAHCDLVMDTLGQMHAASMVLAEQDSHAMDQYSFGVLRPGRKPDALFDFVFVKGFNMLMEMAANWPGYEDVVQRMLPLKVNRKSSG